jgi:hypothetical protein
MAWNAMIASIIKKKAESNSMVSYKGRHIGDEVFNTIVEMAYEMYYADRFRRAKRSNVFEMSKIDLYQFLRPQHPIHLEQLQSATTIVPFDAILRRDYGDIKLGDVMIKSRFLPDTPNAVMCLGKVVRINKKQGGKVSSFSLEWCDQDGRPMPLDYDLLKFNTKGERDTFHKVEIWSKYCTHDIITGTTHKKMMKKPKIGK